MASLHWAPVPPPTNDSKDPFCSLGSRGRGRKPLVNCGVLSSQARRGPAGWGKWPMEAALPGICDVQGGEAAARALAASPKTLNFPDSNYNQGGTEKQAQWQMQLLPGCSAQRCWARGGCASVEDPPELRAHIYSSVLC